jgi:hypothetical protein
MYLGIVLFVAAIFAFSLIRMSSAKTSAFDTLVYLVNTAFVVGVIGFGVVILKAMRPYAISLLASLVIAAVQVVLCVVSINYGKLLARVQEVTPAVVAEEPVEVVEDVVEEVVPSEEILEAEAIDEFAVEELLEEAPVETTEETVEEEMPTLHFASSYMRSKNAEPVAPAATPAVCAYDWFIESLNAEEKSEFVELFIFKYLGGTVNLPEYVPGGDNYEFFRNFFVNLGKYRNRISDSLIEKMYQYMVKKY